MQLLNTAYRQTATVWTQGSPDGYGGFTYDTPRKVRCRWEEVSKEFTDRAGEVQVSRAVVYLPEDVSIGDYIYLGESSAADPTTVDGAYEVRQFQKVPNLQYLYEERRAYL